MYTNEEAIKIIWDKLIEPIAPHDKSDIIEWANVCEAMAHISEQLNAQA